MFRKGENSEKFSQKNPKSFKLQVLTTTMILANPVDFSLMESWCTRILRTKKLL